MEDWRTGDVVLRTGLSHLAAEFTDLRQEVRTDIRRLDDRIFQLMLLQLATLATGLVSIVVALIS